MQALGCPIPSSATVDEYSTYIDYIEGQYVTPNPQPLTFTATESGTFKLSGNSVSYSLDSGETWTTLASNTDSPTVSAGSKIMWKATLTPSSNGIGRFSSTANFTVEGNIMSLLYGDNFSTRGSLYGKDYAFQNLFSGCTRVTSAENLLLPATILADSCYIGMFQGCTSLTTAPSVLPATALAKSCYYNMFNGCSGLTTAPELHATTLASSCCGSMFYNCTSLTTAPELPATTLATQCYNGMFQGCTSLTTAPSLPATTLETFCYYGMFQGCTSLTTAPELHATTLANYCCGSMFQGCTSLTTAPSLPATTLVIQCYIQMFKGCTSLTTAPELPATTLASNCYYQMFYGCTSLNYIKAMFTTTPTDAYMDNWVNGVASSGTFVKNNAATWTISCDVSTYPCNWTVETASS